MLSADGRVYFVWRERKIPQILRRGVDHWGITKQIETVILIIIENFFLQFITCCPRSSISGNILQTLGQKFSKMTLMPVTICIVWLTVACLLAGLFKNLQVNLAQISRACYTWPNLNMIRFSLWSESAFGCRTLLIHSLPLLNRAIFVEYSAVTCKYTKNLYQ